MTDHLFTSAVQGLCQKVTLAVNSVSMSAENVDRALEEIKHAEQALAELKKKFTEKKKEAAAEKKEGGQDGIVKMDSQAEIKARQLNSFLASRDPKQSLEAANGIIELAKSLAADKKNNSQVLSQLAGIIGAYAGSNSKSEQVKNISNFVNRLARTSGQTNF